MLYRAKSEAMPNLPSCPSCNSEFTYQDAGLYVCPECAHEWTASTGEPVAQERIVQAQRLRERFVGLRGIDADREMRDVKAPDLLATLTE